MAWNILDTKTTAIKTTADAALARAGGNGWIAGVGGVLA